MPTEEVSLAARLAASLPKHLSDERTMLLVRQAVARAHNEQLPLTATVIAELVRAKAAE